MRYLILTVAICMLLVIGFTFGFTDWGVAGEKRWETYKGTLIEFDIDCEQCCHPSSYFRINTSKGIKSEMIGNCNEELERLVDIGNSYTIRIEPYAEPFAISRNWGEPHSYWSVCIDWIKDSKGNVIYGSEWF